MLVYYGMPIKINQHSQILSMGGSRLQPVSQFLPLGFGIKLGISIDKSDIKLHHFNSTSSTKDLISYSHTILLCFCTVFVYPQCNVLGFVVGKYISSHKRIRCRHKLYPRITCREFYLKLRFLIKPLLYFLSLVRFVGKH